MAIIGLGNRRYRVEKDWIKLPMNRKLKKISAISKDDKGYIYVLQRDDPFMMVFSSDGHLVNKWFNKTISDGHYLSITPNGKVFVTDRDNHRIVILNTSGRIIQTIGNSKYPGALGVPFNHPTDVAIATNGNIFISDGYGNACIHHFDPTGKLINTWGKLGRKEGEFITPHAILIDEQNRVLIADRENNRIQIFNQDGDYLHEIKNLYHPMNIYQDNDGFIYVTDQSPALSLFNSKFELIGRCRTTGIHGHGLTVDDNGNIYITEMHLDYITKFVYLS